MQLPDDSRRQRLSKLQHSGCDPTSCLWYTALQIGGFIIGPQNDVQRQVCNSQMIRDVSGYQNFSTLGVILLLVFGTLLFRSADLSLVLRMMFSVRYATPR